MEMRVSWRLCLLAIIPLLPAPSRQMSCTYGARGSLTSTCVEAVPSYFKTTSYRFDNLDETVRCANCSLQIIEGNTFDISGNQIKTLDLTSSKINILKPKAFIGLVFLKRLLLPDNHISAVPADTFQGINKIELLDLENNFISGLVANGFKELTNLKVLNLKGNHIKSIENGSFEGLYSVEELDLSNNLIESFANVFYGLANIGTVDLQANKIAKLEPIEIRDMTLVSLNLAGNELKSVADSAFVSFPHLEYLNLSSNPIDALGQNSFRGLDSLRDLDLNRCSIGDIQKGVFYNLHLLRNLNLAYNRLSTFRSTSLAGLPELRRLNVSHNKIESYVKTGLFSLHSLTVLDLSYNSLQDLDYRQLHEHIPALSHLALNNNPWRCRLGKELEEHFKHDNLAFVIDKNFEDPSYKCNDSAPTSKPKEGPVDQTEYNPKTAQLVSESNGHEYVLYIFMSITIAAMVFLFYLQYKIQRDLRTIIGPTNIAEVNLLSSSDLEAKDDY